MKNNPEKHTVDWSFIKKLEGFELKGYVPYDKEGGVESGVTICAGFDLGQQTVSSLMKFNLPPEIYAKLHRYAGVRGFKAKQLLKNSPLTLSKKEGDIVDNIVKQMYFLKVQKEYNDNSDITFSFLESAKQTVVCSVAFQYGSLKKRCPRFFKYATRGQWDKVVQELRNFGDDYPVRRNKEADLLESSLKGKQ